MKRILSIDGGGIKGTFPASFLATVEESIQGRVADYFDLIVGTSTGGIIALGLGLGLTAKEILGFYEEHGPRIFAGSRILRTLRRFGLAKYRKEPLRAALESTFGARLLGNSSTRLVIPSLNLETGEVYIYKTSHHPKFERDYKVRAVDVALATAAAPTYFPTHRSAAGTPLVDGGMWANNPVGLAVVEALGILEWQRSELRVLSLGCTTEPLDVGLGRRFALGMTYWGLKIADVFMSGQSSAALGSAKILVGPQNLFRISPVVARKRFSLDAAAEIPALKGLGDSEARTALPALRETFFSSKADQFSPFKSEKGQ